MNSQQDQSTGKSQSGTPNRAQSASSSASNSSSDSSKQGQRQSQSQSSPSLSDALRSHSQAPGADSQVKRENLGTEQISGLNSLDTPSQARGIAEMAGNHNSQTGVGAKAQAAAEAAQPKSSHTADRGAQKPSSSSASGSSSSAKQKDSGTAAWQQTLKTGWQTVSERVRTASPTELALGAAAIGAALWLGTRKRSSSASAGSSQQSAADRWGQPDQSRFGQASNETWQRPTSERWDD